MKKEKKISTTVKILISMMLFSMLTHLTKNESKREKVGKALISTMLLFVLFCLTLFMGWFGFFAGLLLIIFIHKEMNHETATW